MSLSGLVQVWDLGLGSGFKMRPIYNSAAVFCVKFVRYHLQGWILEYRFPS